MWAVALAVAALLTAFAFHGYPTPGTDAPSFLVSAINHALGRGLVNPFYPQIAFGDPSGAAPPRLLSARLPAGGERAHAVAHAARRLPGRRPAARGLGAAGRAACCAAWRTLPAARTGAGLTLLVSLSLCGLATSWLPTLGRPEALATLLRPARRAGRR